RSLPQLSSSAASAALIALPLKLRPADEVATPEEQLCENARDRAPSPTPSIRPTTPRLARLDEGAHRYGSGSVRASHAVPPGRRQVATVGISSSPAAGTRRTPAPSAGSITPASS